MLPHVEWVNIFNFLIKLLGMSSLIKMTTKYSIGTILLLNIINMWNISRVSIASSIVIFAEEIYFNILILAGLN
jgi:hypothetical protein